MTIFIETRFFISTVGGSGLVQRTSRSSCPWPWRRNYLQSTAERASSRICARASTSKCALLEFTTQLRTKVILILQNLVHIFQKLILFFSFIPDIHRNIEVNNFKPKLDDSDTLNSWGLQEQHPSKPEYSDLNPYIKEPQAT